MKINLLVAAALLFSAPAFAQSTNKNKQGATVSTTAKSQTEVDTKGSSVSGTASAKSQASVNRKNQTPEEREQRKADRKTEREARMQEQKDIVADAKSENEARKEEHSADVKAAIESRAEILNERKENHKEVKEEAKANKIDSDDLIIAGDAKAKAGLNKSERKTQKANRPIKLKTGGKVGTDIKIRRPSVGAKVQGTAGLGLGNR